MKSPSELLDMDAELNEFGSIFLKEINNLVGEIFNCNRNRIVTWEDIDNPINWEITDYDNHREQFELRGEGEHIPYYPSKLYLLNLLNEIGE
ncbi:hypothetical protein ACIQ1D_19190 [Lysinibacillus xylanilyticus]|uniref:hypothetical protein n=1 Tax=Lysinibacillus xylanilyticus TaxID=582475 RepID=UPI003803316B